MHTSSRLLNLKQASVCCYEILRWTWDWYQRLSGYCAPQSALRQHLGPTQWAGFSLPPATGSPFRPPHLCSHCCPGLQLWYTPSFVGRKYLNRRNAGLLLPCRCFPLRVQRCDPSKGGQDPPGLFPLPSRHPKQNKTQNDDNSRARLMSVSLFLTNK